MTAMKFDPPLIPARLVRRYKRFLADVILDRDESAITVAVPNTGSMLGLTEPGSRVWLSRSDRPGRKYAHTLELVEAGDTLVGVNTGLPNRLAEEAIRAGLVSDLASYPLVRREQRYGVSSRIDILLGCDRRPPVHVEVKNVHYCRTPGIAEFPDSVTARGAKHLEELARIVAEGGRAVMVYVIQRGDCGSFRLCADLDPRYAAAFRAARAAGVEAYAVRCHITTEMIRPECIVPLIDP